MKRIFNKNRLFIVSAYRNFINFVFSLFSPGFLRFVNVLVDMSPEERKAFLQFTTGCSSLPPGGLANLYPRLTIVRKVDAGEGSYPSVNTCVHYLKLPDYSTEEILRQRLLAATKEKGFHLNWTSYTWYLRFTLIPRFVLKLCRCKYRSWKNVCTFAIVQWIFYPEKSLIIISHAVAVKICLRTFILYPLLNMLYIFFIIVSKTLANNSYHMHICFHGPGLFLGCSC